MSDSTKLSAHALHALVGNSYEARVARVSDLIERNRARLVGESSYTLLATHETHALILRPQETDSVLRISYREGAEGLEITESSVIVLPVVSEETSGAALLVAEASSLSVVALGVSQRAHITAANLSARYASFGESVLTRALPALKLSFRGLITRTEAMYAQVRASVDGLPSGAASEVAQVVSSVRAFVGRVDESALTNSELASIHDFTAVAVSACESVIAQISKAAESDIRSTR